MFIAKPEPAGGVNLGTVVQKANHGSQKDVGGQLAKVRGKMRQVMEKFIVR